MLKLFIEKMNLIGQVVHIRNVSKKLMFIDMIEKLKIQDSITDLSNLKRITVIMKYTTCGEKLISDARASNSKIHVGDIVQFLGEFEDNNKQTFLPSAFEILSRWKEKNPNTSFVSIPPRYVHKL